MIRKTLAMITIVSGLTLLPAIPPARADFIPIATPGAAYLGATTALGLGAALDFDVLTELSDATETVKFTNQGLAAGLAVLTVPANWSSWGSPPGTESATPRVLWTNGLTLLQMDLTAPAFTFGFEAQPNTQVVDPITATFFRSGALIGTITLDVDGNAGAKLFAATTSTDPFDQVIIEVVPDDFAIANVRYGTVAAAAVPEPGLAALFLLALGSMLLMRRRGREQARQA